MNVRPPRLVRLVAVAALTVLGALTAGCGDDSAPVADSSSAITTSDVPTSTATTEPTDTEPTGVPTTAVPDTTAAPATTAAPTTAAPPPTTAAPAGWTEVGSMPPLAYLPCCASNYVGDPSPAIDPGGAALAPGVYKATRAQPADGVPNRSAITYDLAPFEPCGTPGVYCEDPYAAGEVGVGEVAREVTVPLDTNVRIVVGGFGCAADGTYLTDHRAATGVELAALEAELDTAYQQVVAPLVEADLGFEEVQATFSEPQAGFGLPCQLAGQLQFQGSAGPALLLQSLGAYDENLGRVVVPASIAIEIVRLTAVEVAADGSQTLYFYAGFLS